MQPPDQVTVALLQAALESTYDGILVVDLNGRIVRYNRQLLKMFRIAPEAMPEDSAVVVEMIAAQVRDPEAFRRSIQVLRSKPGVEALDTLHFTDGRVFERFVAPHRVGSKIHGRVITFHDLTAVVKATSALQHHRELLERAQQVAHVGSWTFETAGPSRIELSTETFRILGIEPSAFAGTIDAFLAIVHEDDRDVVRTGFEEARASQPVSDLEYRIGRPDGSLRWVHQHAEIARLDDGGGARAIGTVQDITERRLLEEQLRQSQKMEAMGQLAGGVAHDLNNALTAIAGYVELALGTLREHPAASDVQEIKRAAERAASVTRQLLAFSRKQLLQPRPFDVNDTIAGVARMLARVIGGDIALQTDLQPDVPAIHADRGQIEQALINLAVNARDAMPQGGRLTLSSHVINADERTAPDPVRMRPGRYVLVRVSDTGHGMTSETRARVFEPFFTTKEVGKGTGLGLSMVYGTVKQSGGYIFVDSQPGQGTTFSLYFPSSAAAPQSAQPPAVQRPPDTGTGRARSETLLVVEDEDSIRQLVFAALTNDGYRVLVARSGEEALACVRHEPIDLLLTDAMMPGMSGVELAERLTRERPGLPVILMSGYTEDVVLGSAPADRHFVMMQKPFTPRELRARLRNVLDARPRD